MATESPLIHDGGNLTLSTSFDARRSSITGTTLNGPNGSGQYYPVVMSTANDRQVQLSSVTAPSTFAPVVGILQNAPGPGQAADVGIFGVTKAIAGLTITRGQLLQVSSTAGGYVTPYLQGNGAPIGYAYESAVVGQVFTMFLAGGLFGRST